MDQTIEEALKLVLSPLGDEGAKKAFGLIARHVATQPVIQMAIDTQRREWELGRCAANCPRDDSKPPGDNGMENVIGAPRIIWLLVLWESLNVVKAYSVSLVEDEAGRKGAMYYTDTFRYDELHGPIDQGALLADLEEFLTRSESCASCQADMPVGANFCPGCGDAQSDDAPAHPDDDDRDEQPTTAPTAPPS